MVMYDESDSEFISSREGNKPYVDKSGFIADVLRMGKKACLITRPRRFGKSMNLSMMDAYLNLRYAETGRKWFKGLKVEESEECRVHMHAYPVIVIDFTLTDSRDRESFEGSLGVLMSNVYDSFPELRDSGRISGAMRSRYRRTTFLQTDRNLLASSALDLCRMLHEHHGVRPVVLIDEYDKPVTDSYDREDHEEILDFLRTFMRFLLKNNRHMTMCIMTGVSQVPKESMFSDLNNLYVNNVLSTDLDEWFGFTEEEVATILSDDDGNVDPERMNAAREWYDGYRMGNVDVYNPWSVLRFNNERRTGEYWTSTGNDRIIRDLLRNPDEGMHKDLEKLLNGEGIVKNVLTETSLRDLGKSNDHLFSMMLIAGYLTAKPHRDMHMLSIPNLEVGRRIGSMISGMGEGSTELVLMNSLANAIMNGDEAGITDSLPGVMNFFFPYGKANYEEGYRTAIMACMAFLGKRFEVRREHVAGSGRSDIHVIRRYGPGCNVVIEIKRMNDRDDGETVSEKALHQIGDRNYTDGMTGRTLIYGFALGGKGSVVKKGELNLPCREE